MRIRWSLPCVLRAFLCVLCGYAVPASLSAQDTGWQITSFDVEYRVAADRTVEVTERIAVDFGALQKHGIFREIPIRYNRVAQDVRGVSIPAGRVTVDLDLLGVTDGNGRALETDVSRGDRVRIRIGSADVVVSGPQVYVIHYRLQDGAIGFFADHDELYWQVTGTDWPVPILTATARVIVPTGGTPADTAWTAWCYAGWSESSSNERCTASVTPAQEYRFSVGRLDPGEGLTLVAGFPKGVVPEPTEAERLAKRFSLYWPLGLPALTLFGMFWLWWTRGREPHVGSIVPQWKVPDDLRPGIAGTLVRQRPTMDDIVATLLDLAVRGYIKINEVPPDGALASLDSDSIVLKALRKIGIGKTDWNIVRLSKSADDLLGFEQAVLTGVLEGRSSRKMSELHNEFYTHISGIQGKMLAETVARRWFARSPIKVVGVWVGLGFAAMLLGIMAAVVLRNGVLAIGVVVSSIIVMAFAGAMPVMTALGARTFATVKGLEEYIRRAEKLELELTQAPKRNTELFSRLLPYAIALDATDIWVDQFAAALTSDPPTWYVGNYGGGFNMHAFHSSITSFSTAASRTMGSRPGPEPGSSSGGGGGGSVGGGGGGGGGGSW